MNVTSIIDTIGNTPLIKLARMSPKKDVSILVKLEFLNPGFSIKDRIVKYIIEEAEKTGKLKPGGTILESTSGNTGASVAMIASIKGYQAILTAPDKVSSEKLNSLKAYGAKVIVCKTDVPPDSEEHYVNKCKALKKQIPNSFLLGQYDNKKNPEAHYYTTGPEIWKQTGGRIDYFIASASTGGTISGVGRYLKEKNKNIQVIMPDPIGSVYYDFFKTKNVPPNARCNYKLEGIGEDHLAKAIDFSFIDDVQRVSDKEAFKVTRELAIKEGILAGGSTGANIYCAIEIAKNLTRPSVIVTICPDSGVKYLSKIYNNDWMRENQFL